MKITSQVVKQPNRLQQLPKELTKPTKFAQNYLKARVAQKILRHDIENPKAPTNSLAGESLKFDIFPGINEKYYLKSNLNEATQKTIINTSNEIIEKERQSIQFEIKNYQSLIQQSETKLAKQKEHLDNYKKQLQNNDEYVEERNERINFIQNSIMQNKQNQARAMRTLDKLNNMHIDSLSNLINYTGTKLGTTNAKSYPFISKLNNYLEDINNQYFNKDQALSTGKQQPTGKTILELISAKETTQIQNKIDIINTKYSHESADITLKDFVSPNGKILSIKYFEQKYSKSRRQQLDGIEQALANKIEKITQTGKEALDAPHFTNNQEAIDLMFSDIEDSRQHMSSFQNMVYSAGLTNQFETAFTGLTGLSPKKSPFFRNIEMEGLRSLYNGLQSLKLTA